MRHRLHLGTVLLLTSLTFASINESTSENVTKFTLLSYSRICFHVSSRAVIYQVAEDQEVASIESRSDAALHQAFVVWVSWWSLDMLLFLDGVGKHQAATNFGRRDVGCEMLLVLMPAISSWFCQAEVVQLPPAATEGNWPRLRCCERMCNPGSESSWIMILRKDFN
jgi:hypothetical protein